MIDDIEKFLTGEDPNQTNQILVGYETLFCGFVVRSQYSLDDNNKYKDLNKILIVNYMYYYQKYWRHWNDIAHNKTYQ